MKNIESFALKNIFWKCLLRNVFRNFVCLQVQAHLFDLKSFSKEFRIGICYEQALLQVMFLPLFCETEDT